MTNLRLNHDFFQLISGRSAIRSKELVKEELSANKTKLLEGLLSYKKPSANSALKLKGDKSIGKPELNFCVRLSKFLDLDECQSQHLFESFLIHGFRGSAKQLQAILKDERSVQALLLKVWDYYQTERIQLLHCLKQVLSFCEELDHPYNDVYLECLKDLQRQKLVDKLIAQYEDRCQAVAPTKLDVGPPMTDRQSLKWSLQCLREQCELLEIILLYFKSFEATEKRILSLIKLFQKQGFGTRQTNKHLYDGDTTADQLMNRIGFNCCLIILECLDLYQFLGETTHERTSKHKLVSCKETFNELNKLIGSLGNIIHYGPLILAWTSLHAAAFPDKDPEFVQKLGQCALQLQVFQYLYTMLNLVPFNSDAVLSPLSHTIVYGLLNLVLSIFDEQTLGSPHILVHLTCQLLEQKHLCETFWEEDVDGGIAMLLHSATMKFPMEFSPLLQLMKAMATSGTKKVYEYLNHLPHFTELLDNNRADEIQSMKQAGIWTRVTDKILFSKADGSNSFVIPALTTGVLFDQNTADPLIRWDYVYSGWLLFTCQMENFLESIIQGLGSETQASQNQSIVELVGHMLKSSWSISENFKQIIQQIYRFIQQLSSLPHPPLKLITSCLDCITTIAEHSPQEVWKELQQIGFLPHTGNLYTEVARAASGDGIFPGHYGNLLHRHEQPSGVYPVTLSCLNLLHQLVKGLSSVNVGVAVGQDLLASVVFMQREVFTVFHKWRCNVFSDRETIGQKCLEIFHIILNTAQGTSSNQTKKSRGVTLREACIHGFLNFESGQALLNIVSTGVDAIDQRANENGCTFSGPVERLTQLIKLAFSVLNRLMIWQPANHEPSPMEQVLTSHTTGLPHQPHLVALIAGYIYHKFDPRLPTLATLLLKRLAFVAPMSVYGCLGNHAVAIRDTYLYRLQSHSEDARLRVVILEFLSSAVESQPGLIEMFLNLNFKEKKTTVAPGKKGDKTKTKQVIEIGKLSCLHTVLDILDEQKQGTTHCPPDLQSAAVGFLLALWQGRQQAAMTVLRERPDFWKKISAPLFKDLTKSVDTCSQMKACGYAMKIMALECFYIKGSALEKGLQEVLKKFNHEQKYKIWSQIIREMMENRAGEEDDAEDLFMREDEGLILLQAWRMFLLVLSSSPPSDQVKVIILNDLIASIKSQVVATMSTFHVRACLLLGSVYLSLLKRWTSLHGDQWNKLIDLIFITEHLTDEDLKSFIRLRVLMLSSITVLLQYQRGKNPKALEDTTISRLLSVICSSLRHSKMYYQRTVPSTPKVPVKKSTTISEKEIVESVEKRSQTKLEKKSEQLPIVGVYMLDELILSVDTENLWLPMLRQHSVLALLLSTVQACMESMKGLDYVESVLLLFLDIATYPEAAEALQVTGLIQHICLPLSRVYSNSVPQTPKVEKTESVTWLSIYRISLSLMTGMVTTLKHSFLSDALSFFGVHHDRMQQCLQAVESNYSTSCQKEAERTMEFIFQLSRFFKEWRFQMPQAVQQVQARVCYLCHHLVALLMRPRLLQHLIEFDKKGGKEDKQQMMHHSMGSLARLQHQTSTEDFDTPSAELQAVQSGLFIILGNGLAALRHFTPDFLEILCSPIIDVSEFPLLFALAFTSPTVDHDSPPSFGSLVACINTCVRFLSTLEGVRSTSPIRSPSKSPQARLVPLKDSPIQRSVVMFVLESALFLIMSQCLRYLKEPSSVGQREKQLLKRELGSELGTFLLTLQRFFRRGGNVTSPSAASSSPLLTTPSIGKSSLHHGSFTDSQEQAYFNLVRQFVKQILR